MKSFDVWTVKKISIKTGTNIEGFDVEFKIFQTYKEALDNAWAEAQKYALRRQGFF